MMNIEEFYNWLKINKDSEETVNGYYKKVKKFVVYSDGVLNQETLNNYFVYLKENKSASSFNGFINAIKSYFDFSNKEFDLPKYKRNKKRSIKFYFEENDLEKITKSIYSDHQDKHKEREIIILFMFYTGARPSDLFNLKRKNINFDKEEINFINGKGQKDRTIYFLNKKLENDLKRFCSILNPDDPVFTISYTQLTRMFNKIKKRFKIDGIVEPRTMRISFAKHCINIGIDLLILKKLMGHTDIKVTELYAEPDEKMIKEACKKIKNR